MKPKLKKLIGAGIGGALVMLSLDSLRRQGYLLEMPMLARLAVCGILGAGASWLVQFVFYRVVNFRERRAHKSN